jgi:hypothetical protein
MVLLLLVTVPAITWDTPWDTPWDTLWVIVLAALVLFVAVMGLWATLGLVKHEALRTRAQGVTMAVAVAIFVVGWVAGCALGVHSAVTQIGRILSAPLTLSSGLQRAALLSVVGFVALLLLLIPLSILEERTTHTRLKKAVGGVGGVLAGGIVLLSFLNQGINGVLNWYDDFLSTPLALFIIVAVLGALTYLLRLVRGGRQGSMSVTGVTGVTGEAGEAAPASFDVGSRA